MVRCHEGCIKTELTFDRLQAYHESSLFKFWLQNLVLHKFNIHSFFYFYLSLLPATDDIGLERARNYFILKEKLRNWFRWRIFAAQCSTKSPTYRQFINNWFIAVLRFYNYLFYSELSNVIVVLHYFLISIYICPLIIIFFIYD